VSINNCTSYFDDSRFNNFFKTFETPAYAKPMARKKPDRKLSGIVRDIKL